MPNNDEVNKLAEMLGQPRITETEKGILQNAFGIRYELFILIRNVLLGFELDEVEKGLVRSVFASPEIRRVIRKIYLPEIGKNIPLGYTSQNMDLWMTKEFQNLQSHDDKVWEKFVQTKERFFELMEQALKRLENPDIEPIDISVRNKSFVDITARNGYIAYVEQQTVVVATLSSSSTKAPEEIAKIIKQNSTK